MEGYFQYGVELPWDGRNALPAMMAPDCMVEVRCKIRGQVLVGNAGRFNWMMVESYKVVDERYKPIDDFGELPPVGFTQNECAVVGAFEKHFAQFKVVAHESDHAIIAVTRYKNDTEIGCWPYALTSDQFRPVKTDRDKFIDAAVNIIEHSKFCAPEEIAGDLFDAGFKAPE